MVDGSLGDHADAGFAEPLPEHDIFIQYGGLELLLLLQVENLDRSALGLERDDISVPVHDSTVGIDRAPGDFIVVLEVDDDDLWLLFIAEFLSDADIVV